MNSDKFPSGPVARVSRRERGAALIVTVLLMLVISMLALTALVRNNLDERMAFNQRDRQLAFQAAEGALRAAEEMIVNNVGGNFSPLMVSNIAVDCTQSTGFCRSIESDPGWRRIGVAAWEDQSQITVALGTNSQRTPIQGVSAQPRYLIEYQGTEQKIDNGNTCTAHFLITARGVGLNANSTTTLQSLFRWKIGACYDAI